RPSNRVTAVALVSRPRAAFRTGSTPRITRAMQQPSTARSTQPHAPAPVRAAPPSSSAPPSSAATWPRDSRWGAPDVEDYGGCYSTGRRDPPHRELRRAPQTRARRRSEVQQSDEGVDVDPGMPGRAEVHDPAPG